MLQEVQVPVLWDFQQAEIKTGIKKFTLTRLVKTGKIKYIRLGAGQRGKILINAKSLCDFLSGGDNE